MKFSIKQLFEASVLLVLVLAVFSLAKHGSFCILAEDDVSSKIDTADNALQWAFASVLDAENAGANVSALLVKLDAAGKNLTEAQMAYENSDLIEAESKAEECSAIANSVADEASALKSSALLDTRSAEWRTFSFLGVGAFVFLAVLTLVWVVFMRFYGRRLLGLRPEAGSDVEA